MSGISVTAPNPYWLYVAKLLNYMGNPDGVLAISVCSGLPLVSPGVIHGKLLQSWILYLYHSLWLPPEVISFADLLKSDNLLNKLCKSCPIITPSATGWKSGNLLNWLCKSRPIITPSETGWKSGNLSKDSPRRGDPLANNISVDISK